MIENIEKLRKNKGYNQDEIANKLDIARQTYSKIESGKKEITLGIVVKLAEILGVEVWGILGEYFSVKEKKEIDWDKYKQIVRFCIENGTGGKFKITKTKLVKLCYLVDFTHNQLPWMICSDKEIIPYNLITQEDFDNVY